MPPNMDSNNNNIVHENTLEVNDDATTQQVTSEMIRSNNSSDMNYDDEEEKHNPFDFINNDNNAQNNEPEEEMQQLLGRSDDHGNNSQADNNKEEMKLLQNDINRLREDIASHDRTIDEMRRLIFNTSNNSNSNKNSNNSSSNISIKSNNNSNVFTNTGSNSAMNNKPRMNALRKSVVDIPILSQERSLIEVDHFEDLSEDAYNFILLGDFRCQKNVPPAFIGWFVFVLQMSVYTLVFFSGLSMRDSRHNQLGFPPDVVVSTRIGQVFAIVIAVMTQDDLRTALKMFVDGQNKLKFVMNYNNNDDTEGIVIPRWKWWCAVCSRAVQGFAGLFVSFILVMQTGEVIELLLNFTALQFVSQLDDVVFRIAREGFLGKRCKRITLLVSATAYYYDSEDESPFFVRDKKAARALAKAVRTMVLILTLVSMLAAWGSIFSNQVKGRYSCTNLYVQFDDDSIFVLGTLSGKYEYERRDDIITYKLTDIDGSMNNSVARFQYCYEEEFWAFAYNITNPLSLDEIDICEKWTLRSSEDALFMADIIAASFATWFVRKENNEIIMNHFRLYCSECDENEFCAPYGTCNTETNKCVCDEGWFGIQCGFSEPCQTIELDTRRFNLDSSPYSYMWSKTYTRLDVISNESETNILEINSRPVYYNKNENSRFDLIIFLGRRWVITASHLMGWYIEMNETELATQLKDYFRDNWRDETFFSFISTTIDFDTSTDAVSPVGVDFSIFESSTYNDVKSADVAFLCSHCHNLYNPCEAEGVCGEDNRCSCTNGASGSLCEHNPLGDGFCNEYFNAPRFDYDRGDCCQATCISSTYKCGYDKNSKYIGYCKCKDPTYACNAKENAMCWQPNSETIFGEIDFAESGASIALSADGRTLAVGEPGSESVRVFRSDGSKWEPMGQTLRGAQNSRFGESVAIGGDGNILVVGSPNFEIPDKVDPTRRTNNYQGMISVYKAGVNSWQTVYETPSDRPVLPWLTHGRLGATLALSQDGKNIFVTFPYTNSDGKPYNGYASDGVILQLQYQPTSHSYIPKTLNNTNKNSVNMGKSISISKSGHIIALGANADDLGQYDMVLVYRHVFYNNSRALSQLGKRIKGCCGLISGDGKMLMVSLPGYKSPKSQVYFWKQDQPDSIDGDWVELGSLLNGTPAAISFDGMTVAITTTTLDFTIQTFIWTENIWVYQGNVTKAKDASVELLSGNNNTETIIAVGMPVRDLKGSTRGSSSVYGLTDLQRTRDSCGLDGLARSSSVRVELTTDAKPNETLWEIRDYFKKTTLLRGGPYNNSDSQYSVIIDEAILSSTVSCAEFRIFDLGGDGICCDKGLGSYSLFFGGNIEKVGGMFSWSDSHLFGDCECEEDESLFGLKLNLDSFGEETVWTLTDEFGDIISEGGPFVKDDVGVPQVESRCIPSDRCVEFTIYDTAGDGLCCEYGYGKYSVSWDGGVYGSGGEFLQKESMELGYCQSRNISNSGGMTSIPEYCNGGASSMLQVGVTVNPLPSATKWILVLDGNTILKGGPYDEESTTYQDACINMNLCYYFEILDSVKNARSSFGRYSLSLDGEEIASHALSPTGNRHWIGNCGHVAKPIIVAKGDSISCSGGLQNSCVSRAECAAGGMSLEPTGDSLLFDLDFRNARWTTSGEYSLTFQKDCSVVCFGCYSSPALSLPCNDGDIAFNLWFYDISLNETLWRLESQNGTVLHKGGPYQDTLDSASRVIAKIGNTRTWTYERRCLARAGVADSCSARLTFRKQRGRQYGVYFYMDAEYLMHLEFDKSSVASLSTASNRTNVTIEQTDTDASVQLGICL